MTLDFTQLTSCNATHTIALLLLPATANPAVDAAEEQEAISCK